MESIRTNQCFEPFFKRDDVTGTTEGGGFFHSEGKVAALAKPPGEMAAKVRGNSPNWGSSTKCTRNLNRSYRTILNPKASDGNGDAGQGLVGPRKIGIGQENLAEGFIGH